MLGFVWVSFAVDGLYYALIFGSWLLMALGIVMVVGLD